MSSLRRPTYRDAVREAPVAWLDGESSQQQREEVEDNPSPTDAVRGRYDRQVERLAAGNVANRFAARRAHRAASSAAAAAAADLIPHPAARRLLEALR